ncbi:hypothetical protein IFM58399_05788 [Aspergillus lentulus]|uniref:Cytochrome P450 n=1 Tax=Aspergillus lentulus TaxID=293939 RepID=A0AAN5YSC9_ASPLE|nr:uncharacterized protein IFM58399_05788 [Aspergillus lentulus]KAF4155502.1 hypothetical protein CNMCM6069_007910 [Aspergillus lentulus]KAF4162270.1 hypothetical protein CNMCM6936_002370 [Aspergillus lentulus]KAF4188548.1 hypothetical protein CNMCM7927_001243 [Aspergillus lentulus]KAF4206956.1 hypothetical protein CNMCM8927_004051 [Aspergillus lentulus]GFF40034.1 hypothetical protein IFM58399_05788 [Aspergillus lentulus]
MDFQIISRFTDGGDFQWAKFGTAAFLAVLLSALAFLSYTPRVHQKSPAFTSHKLPFIGSLGFTTEQWNWWKSATAESKTGNFSFWLGQRHVVGVTGEAARKMFFTHEALDFVSGALIRPINIHFWPPIHDIFKPDVKSRSKNTYFLRRLYELQSTEQLNHYLPQLLKDARVGMAGLSRVTKPSVSCWETVFAQDVRLLCTDEIIDDPKLLATFGRHVETLLFTFSHYNVCFPWLPSPSYYKRRQARYALYDLMKDIVNKRLKNGPRRPNDPVQILLDYNDNVDHIIEFFISLLFIAPANSRIIGGQMLNIMSIYRDWQEKVYADIKAAAAAHSPDKNAPLVDQLAFIPLHAWENSFPSIDLCLQETIRMWTSFSMARLNVSPNPIPIPGSDEVIPGNTFVCYNSTEVNFSDTLYPDPKKFDPSRFLDGREEFRNEAYGFLGWGRGRHPCPGMRWAKLQQNIIIAYAVAMYDWSSCDETGKPTPQAVHVKELNATRGTVLPTAYCKLVPREKV